MPSGPKKRLRAKRKKQGSPATDANSDRETEALSVTGSIDVDDLESGLDTPLKAISRPAFLDREAVSSQTDEWVRVSDFDVGTPTSQTEENDPSADDGDIGSSRRSLDKLAEWETVSGEHIPSRQEGSINSMEEEPSESEAPSAHSSGSYTNLPSPHLAVRDKDGDSTDNDRKNKMANRSSCSSSSTNSTGEKRAPTSAENFDSSASMDIGDASSTLPLPSVSAAGEGQVEEIERFNEDSVEAELHGVASEYATEVLSDGAIVPTEEAIICAPDSDDQRKIVGTSGSCGPSSTKAKSVEESHKHGKEKEHPASIEATLVATNPDDEEIMFANGTDISKIDTRLHMPASVEETPDEKENLPGADDSLTQRGISGDERAFTSSLAESGREENGGLAGVVDVEHKDVNIDEKVVSSIYDDSPAADEKEVASTSADAEEKKTKRDAPGSEVATCAEKNPLDTVELITNSFSVKAVPTSGTSQPLSVVEGRHLSVSTPVEKNVTEKRRVEAKSLTGCCGVLYWLLGWDH